MLSVITVSYEVLVKNPVGAVCEPHTAGRVLFSDGSQR